MHEITGNFGVCVFCLEYAEREVARFPVLRALIARATRDAAIFHLMTVQVVGTLSATAALLRAYSNYGRNYTVVQPGGRAIETEDNNIVGPTLKSIPGRLIFC